MKSTSNRRIVDETILQTVDETGLWSVDMLCCIQDVPKEKMAVIQTASCEESRLHGRRRSRSRSAGTPAYGQPGLHQDL